MSFKVYSSYSRNGGGATLAQQLIVSVGGTPVGGANTGEVFAAGTPIENVLRDILIKAFNPTLALATDIATLMQESGSIISPTFNSTFTQNDGGPLLTKILRKNAVQVSAVFPYQDLNVQLHDGDIVYISVATFAAGTIPAGSVNSNTINYQGRRKIFAGTPGAIPASSADVRALALNAINPVVGTQLLIPIAAGSTRVVFAYPATLQDVSSVLYVELSNSEVKSLFTKTLVNVEGANGFAPVSYKVYAYTPIQPFQTAVNYRVII